MKIRLVAVFLFIIFFQTVHAKVLKKVTLQLSWFDQFQFAGYYMAKKKGFYEDVGLDVEIKPFAFGIDIPKEVSDGKFDFAVGRETLILDRTNNRNIVALYALFQATPLVLLSTKESGINTINDFKNRRIMTTLDDSSEVSLKAMINSHKVGLDELKFVKHTHNIMDLVNKNTDVISAYLSKTPYDLRKMGIAYNVFDPKMYGFDMYSDFLYTSDTLLQNDPNTVFLFKQASLKGWEYAYSNIKESVELIYERYNSQNLSKEALTFEGEELKKLSYFDTLNLGEIQEDKLQRIYDLYNVMGLVKNQIDIKEFLAQSNFTTKLSFTQKEQAYLQSKNSIKMCMMGGLMPYADVEDGELKGFISDYTKVLEDKLKLPIDVVQAHSAAKVFEYLQTGVCDMIPGVQMTEERKEFLNFTKPYLKIPFVLITKEDKPFISDLHSIQGKKLSLVKGYAITDLLKKKYPNLLFKEVPELKNTFDDVEKDKAYGTIVPLAIALYTIETNNVKQLKVSAKLDEVNYMRMSVAKDNMVLSSILDKVINSMDSSVIETMLNKWLYAKNKEFNYGLMWQILVVFIFIILAVLYRQHLLKKVNKSLARKVNEKTKELQRINSELEDRIEKEVQDNLKKDRMLSRQTKMVAMGEMIENIAHQWRQPLSIISTGASGLRLKKELNALDDQLFFETMDTIINTSVYLSTTIDDFRYFFKPNTDKEYYSLNQCCQRSVDLLKPKLKGIEMVLNLEDEVKHYGFENEMVQVFINIISNARDALQHSEVERPLIFISVYQSKQKIYITIRDNAGGIDEEIINKVTEPYFTTKHKAQGTGIGLYMCEEIITKHMDGRMEVSNSAYVYDNVEYNGAQFTIILHPQQS